MADYWILYEITFTPFGEHEDKYEPVQYYGAQDGNKDDYNWGVENRMTEKDDEKDKANDLDVIERTKDLLNSLHGWWLAVSLTIGRLFPVSEDKQKSIGAFIFVFPAFFGLLYFIAMCDPNVQHNIIWIRKTWVDECDYVDCSQVPFFHDRFDTTLEIYGSGERGDDLRIQ